MRRAVKSDLAEIYAIMSACVTPAWSESAVSSALLNDINDWFVCESEGRVVAYICVENVIDEGCLSSIAVSPPYRRNGIAKALVTAALRESRMKSVYLEVNENNSAAIALYRSCGFDKIGERKKYYGDCGAVIMRRELQTET